MLLFCWPPVCYNCAPGPCLGGMQGSWRDRPQPSVWRFQADTGASAGTTSLTAHERSAASVVLASPVCMLGSDTITLCLPNLLCQLLHDLSQS